MAFHLVWRDNTCYKESSGNVMLTNVPPNNKIARGTSSFLEGYRFVGKVSPCLLVGEKPCSAIVRKTVAAKTNEGVVHRLVMVGETQDDCLIGVKLFTPPP